MSKRAERKAAAKQRGEELAEQAKANDGLCPTCHGPVEVKYRQDHNVPTFNTKIKGTSSGAKDPWENLQPEQSVVISYRSRRRKGHKTMVVVGTAPMSMGKAPFGTGEKEAANSQFGTAMEIWSLNDCHNLKFMQDNIGDIDAWFQLHHEWRFTRQMPRHGWDHWGWLQEEHPFPIYMQRKYDMVPASVPFPLKETVDKYLFRKLGRGRGYLQKYFTSTFAYMIPFAIDKGFDRIELYGFELAQHK